MADPGVVTALTAVFLTEECCHQSNLPLILLNYWATDSEASKSAPSALKKYLEHQLALCDEKNKDKQPVENIINTLKNSRNIPKKDIDTLTGLVEESFALRRSRQELRKTILQNYLDFLNKSQGEISKSETSTSSDDQSASHSHASNRVMAQPSRSKKANVKRRTPPSNAVTLPKEVTNGCINDEVVKVEAKRNESRRHSYRPVKRPRKMDL